MALGMNVAALRRIRGWTQEELAERSGLSVRTIRNVELGRVGNPRRSSVDLLLRALGADGAATEYVDGAGGHGPWRGLPPSDQPLIGRSAELEQLARTVFAHRLTTFLGPGGVGKTRVALGVANEVRRSFQQGVAVVELGDLPAEGSVSPPPVGTVLRRTMRLVENAEPATPTPAGQQRDTNLLLVLDNAEHIPTAAAAAAKELLSSFPHLHILVTARRPLTERHGVNREISPLPVLPTGGDSLHAPAVELVLRRAGADPLVMADLAADLPGVVELCRRLGGIPRALEFAAERLRTIPLRALLATGPALSMLRTSDHALLPHQRSLAGSIRWSVGLLTAEHQRLLRLLAVMPTTRFTVDDVAAVGERAGCPGPEDPLGLLSDLIDNSLVTACRDRLYECRLAPYVREVICADSDVTLQPESAG